MSTERRGGTDSLSDAQRAQVLAIARVAVGTVLVGWAAAGVTDTDIWGHLRFGLDMLDLGRLPSADTYSFTGNAVWINHEWLWQVLVALIYRAAGLDGILLFRACTVALLLLIIDRATRTAPLTCPDYSDR